MKTYIGQRGRDRVLRVWVENYGRRSPMVGDDVAGRILADVFGPRLIEDDYWCYQTFRDEFIGPRLDEAEWILSETDVRTWRETYAEHAAQGTATNAARSQRSISDPEAAASGEVEQHTLVSWPSGLTRAQLLRVSPSVLLLEGERPPGVLPAPGAPLRVGLPGLPRMVPARLASFGQGSRFLVALGSRAVRGAVRVRVDLPGVVRSPALAGQTSVRVIDLSSSGARLSGLRLPVGADFELTFSPPGHHDPVCMRCVVVRAVDESDCDELGAAFCGGTLTFRIDLGRARDQIDR
jgi:hypothetical protein